MPAFVRGAAAAVVGIAALFLVGSMGGAFLSVILPDALAGILGFLAGAACAWLAGRWIWQALGPTGGASGRGPSPVLTGALTGALLLGALGFVGGFFGPMILAPGANQGPLLGIFFTGPAGVVLGAVGGALYGMSRGRQSAA